MTLLSVNNERASSVKERKYVTEPVEIMAFCPGCKALQTVWLNESRLMSTRKFIQIGSQVYHNCGSSQPCHLYSNW